jgi:epi-isozizaene synthase
MYPNAPYRQLALISDLLAWFFALDDRLDRAGPASRSSATLHTVRAALQHSGRPLNARVQDPLQSAFADLHTRCRTLMSPALLDRLAGHLHATLDAFAHEEQCRRAATPPPEPTYILRRRHTSCAWIFADLTEFATGIEVPATVHAWAEYQELIECAADIAAWDNDLLSLPREMQQGEVNNLVLVLAHADGLELAAAHHQVAARIEERIAHYGDTERLLHARTRHAPLPADTITALRHLIAALRDTLQGVVTWNHADTDRFTHTPGAPPAHRPALDDEGARSRPWNTTA